MAMLKTACAAALATAVLAGCALRAQEHSEVQSVRVPGGTLEQRQQQTGTAFRRLEQVRYETKLAEQDYLNAKAAYDRSKAEFDAASKAYSAARAREKAAEEQYQQGVRSVDELYGGGKSEPRPR